MKLTKKINTRRVAGVAVVSVALISMAGCSAKFTGDDTSNTEINARDYQAFYEHTAEVYKDYVTLGDYKNIEFEHTDRSNETVSEDDVNEIIDTLRSATKETESVTEGTTESGDTVTLDYSGSIDGVEFDGGTATDASYTIGSGQFIDDLDKGLVGLTVGQEYDINVKFPDDYSSDDLKGKDAVFKVTVKSIEKSVEPEVTDDWVKKNSSVIKSYGYGDNVSTIDKLKENISNKIAKTNKENNDATDFTTAYTQILEGSQVNGYPQAELDSLISTYNSNVKNYYESYGSSLGVSSYEEYIQSQYNMDTDAFTQYVEEEAKEYLAKKMIVTLIAADNKVNVSTQEVDELGDEIALYYGYDSYADFLKSYSTSVNCEMGYNVLYTKVCDLVANQTTKTNDGTEETSSSASDESTEATTEVTTEATTETTTEAQTQETTNN